MKNKKSRAEKKKNNKKKLWHKKGKASEAATKILRLLTEKDDASNPPTEGPSTSTQPTMPAQSNKVKRRKNRKKTKRLQKNQNGKNDINRELISKLLSSIKKKYQVQNSRTRKKLNFQKKSPAKQTSLPLPTFYQQKKGSQNLLGNVNNTLEDEESIEEILSSDDDCVLIDDSNASINIEDEQPSTSEQIFKDLKYVEDKCREATLRLKAKTDNKVIYSPRSDGDPQEEVNSSCIVLDDSSDTLTDPKTIVKDANQAVIVVDDSIVVEDFIPLSSGNQSEKRIGRKRRSSTNKTPPKKVRTRMNDSLFTKSEKKKLGDYNSNTYNPAAHESQTADAPKSNKRAVIIDGSNVAFAHGRSSIFSSEGIKICIDYFDKMGHNVKAVMPLFRRNASKSSNPELLDQLHKEGKIVFTPCKNIHGQMSISYDDRFILQLAYEMDAAVVSNDNYRDLMGENPAFKKIVESRVLGYSWCDNIFILPKDPYGRWGPTLSEILKC
ncbi:uncharacterized protein [Drosophila bipectinata]|uniref:uncharacterized protein n=1 Tax=Drosophila bipectinata TaxID=42026 RepID=UPI0038B2F7B3